MPRGKSSIEPAAGVLAHGRTRRARSEAARALAAISTPSTRRASRANGKLGGRPSTERWRLVRGRLHEKVGGRWVIVEAPLSTTARVALHRLLAS